MDIHEHPRDGLEHRSSNGMPVQRSPRAPAFMQAANQNQFRFVLQRQIRLGGQLSAERLLDLKDTGDTPFCRSGAQHMAGRTQGQQQFQRADDQRLAGARLSGEAIQTGLEFDADVGNDRQVADMQFPQQVQPPNQPV